MRGKGINYDTGFSPGGVSSREQFDAGIVRREMRVIADDLHCTAVRISGGDPARLSVAAELAAAAGLEVWFAPFPCELAAADLAPLFAECADRAEHLRRSGAAVVLVCGCELSLFGAGFLPGGTVYERIAGLQAGGGQLHSAFAALPGKLNGFLAATAEDARGRFGGPLSYASGMWEPVDWTPFDVAGVDALPGRRQCRPLPAGAPPAPPARQAARDHRVRLLRLRGRGATAAAWAGPSSTPAPSRPSWTATTSATSASRSPTCGS